MLIADYKGALMTARNKNSSSGTCDIYFLFISQKILKLTEV